MEKRIEKWESLRLEAQEFTPQEYVAGCELIPNTTYVVDTSSMTESFHGVWDTPEGNGDKYYSHAEYLAAQDNSQKFTSNANISGTIRMKYLGTAWGTPGNGVSWPDPGSELWNEQVLSTYTDNIKLYYCFQKTEGGQTKFVYGGKEITEMVPNANS